MNQRFDLNIILLGIVWFTGLPRFAAGNSWKKIIFNWINWHIIRWNTRNQLLSHTDIHLIKNVVELSRISRNLDSIINEWLVVSNDDIAYTISELVIFFTFHSFHCISIFVNFWQIFITSNNNNISDLFLSDSTF